MLERIMATKKTPAQWRDHLASEDAPITLEEFIAGVLSRLLGAQIEATQAAAHAEGMLGAIDQLAEQMAANAGLPYASSGEVRAALDAQRDDLRRLAASQQQQQGA